MVRVCTSHDTAHCLDSEQRIAIWLITKAPKEATQQDGEALFRNLSLDNRKVTRWDH